MSGFTPEELAKAEQILDSVRDEWLEREGVTAVDLGFKWSKGQMTGLLSLRVHVAKKKDVADLDESELFPEEVDGLPVDVIEATYAPQALVDVKPEAAVEGRGIRWDDIPLGVSIGCKYSTAGTLGAKVIDLESGDEMILSNWHVLAGRQDVEPGLAIWQPGWIDGGTRAENTIAELTRWVLGPFDAAVARLNGSRPVQTKTIEGRAIEQLTTPRLGMLVWKSSRSSGFTEGFVDGIKMMVPLNYGGAGVYMLEKVFRIIPRPGSIPGEISMGGDSGAVWVDEESGKAVGLHFAGEVGNTPEHALAHDVGSVLETLKVRLPGQPPPAQEPPAKEPPVQKPPAKKPPSTSRPPSGRTVSRRSFWDDLSLFLRRLFGTKK
jgi:endonuclease G